MTSLFFPSRTMSIYMGRMFLTRTFAVLALLVLVLMALDMLGESGKILAAPGNGEAQIWRYVGLRAPQIIQRFLPFSVLLGTIATLATLNQNSEIISMKSAGLSAHQILAPLILTSFLVALGTFAFNERIVARSTAALSAWQAVDYGPVPPDSGVKTNVWVRDGTDLVNATTVHGSGTDVRLGQVTIYDRGKNTLGSIIRADSGRYVGGKWRLTNARRFDVAQGRVVPLGTIDFGKGIRPDQLTLASVNPDGMSIAELGAAITALDAAGRPTAGLKANWWHKISTPLSSILMPLLGAVAGFGLARSGRLFVRAVLGMALGFAYFVVDNFALAMGNLGAYPPVMAAWAPFILFFLIGETVLVRTEE